MSGVASKLMEAKDPAVKATLDKFDHYLELKHVSPEIRRTVKSLLNCVNEFVSFLGKCKDIPASKAQAERYILTEFTKYSAKKGIALSGLSDDKRIEVGACILSLLLDFLELGTLVAATVAAILGGTTVAIVALVAAFAMLILDALDLGNASETLQEAYYRMFLKTAPRQDEQIINQRRTLILLRP
jgi:hypothetical protein